MSEQPEHVKVLIIGSGPAGYTAALYAARANLSPLLYQGLQPGGQLTITTDVENYPGYPDGIMGPEMMEEFRKQAERFGTDVRIGYVTKVELNGHPHKVIVDEKKEITADTVIISTGATARYLGLESEQRLNGFGVSACAVCDGFFFKGQDVAVVAGGDSACEEASYLSKICSKVYIVVRRDEFRASKIMADRVQHTSNIEILWNTSTVEVLGDKTVDGVKIKNNVTGEESVLKIQGFFLAIGHTPNTLLFEGQLDMDENGYLITKPDSSHTNIGGVFASGDVQDHVYRQAVTAAGSGCMAALDAEKYLAAKGL